MLGRERCAHAWVRACVRRAVKVGQLSQGMVIWVRPDWNEKPPQAGALWRCYVLQWILCLRCHGYLQARCSNPSQDQRTVILSLGPVSIPSTIDTKAFLLLLLAPMGRQRGALQSRPNESRDD